MRSCFRILDHALKRRENNQDTVLLVAGPEGVGKSYFILHCLDYLKAPLSCMHLNAPDFLVGISKMKYDQVIVCDEGADALDIRRTMSSINVDIVNAYKVLRGLRAISFFATPELFSVDKYVTYHRAIGLFYIYKPGRFVFYSQETLQNKILTKQNKKRKRIPILNIKNSDSIPLYKGHLLKEYEPLKKEKMAEMQKYLAQKYTGQKKPLPKKEDVVRYLRNRGLTQGKIAEAIGNTQQMVHIILKKQQTN